MLLFHIITLLIFYDLQLSHFDNKPLTDSDGLEPVVHYSFHNAHEFHQSFWQ